jgi:hypothetical protein
MAIGVRNAMRYNRPLIPDAHLWFTVPTMNQILCDG